MTQNQNYLILNTKRGLMAWIIEPKINKRTRDYFMSVFPVEKISAPKI